MMMTTTTTMTMGKKTKTKMRKTRRGGMMITRMNVLRETNKDKNQA